MKQNNDFNKKEQEDFNIGAILSSLNKTYLKDSTKTLFVDKEILIYKIVDNLNVSSSKAKEYLNILQSRGRLKIEKDTIEYVPVDKQTNLKEIDSDFKKAFGYND